MLWRLLGLCDVLVDLQKGIAPVRDRALRQRLDRMWVGRRARRDGRLATPTLRVPKETEEAGLTHPQGLTSSLSYYYYTLMLILSKIVTLPYTTA